MYRSILEGEGKGTEGKPGSGADQEYAITALDMPAVCRFRQREGNGCRNTVAP
jgi:hypothetical protein